MASFLALTVLLLSSPAWGQNVCASRASLIERAKAEFGEVPVASGLERSGAVMELLSSPSGSWTMIAVNPMGLACVVGTGTALKLVDRGRGA